MRARTDCVHTDQLEVEGCRSAGGLRFLAADVVARLEEDGDLFGGLLAKSSALA